MELFKTYATDQKLEIDGVWVDLGEGAAVKVARFNNPEHRKVTARLRKPYSTYFASGRDLPDDIAEEIAAKSIAEAILLDWRGMKSDGADFPYSKINALKAMQTLRDFRDQVMFLSMQAETFRRHTIEDNAKNLPSSSHGPSDTEAAAE